MGHDDHAGTGLDQEVCVCFHVTLRKLWNHARRERPRVYSLLTECLGAGTGCGSCGAILKVIASRARVDDLDGLLGELEALARERDAARVERLKRRPRPASGAP